MRGRGQAPSASEALRLAIHKPAGEANGALMEPGATFAGLSRSLDAFHSGVKGVTDILAVAGGGLCVAANSQLGRDEIDRIAANLSMLDALTTAAAQYLGGQAVLNTAVQSKGGYLVKMKVNEQLFLAAFADPSCDIGQVVQELCRLCDYLAAITASRVRR
jgi:predicted regulator of Ras-like GTPase activity (Roadblock/LC7/MglB family)